MGKFKIVAPMYLYDGMVTESKNKEKIINENAVEHALHYTNVGADALFITDISENDEEHEKNIKKIIDLADVVDIPMFVGGKIDRLEDVKKYIYAGAAKVVLDGSRKDNLELIKESSERFGSDKIAVKISDGFDYSKINKMKYDGARTIIADGCANSCTGYGISVISCNEKISYEDLVRFAGKEKSYGIVHDSFDSNFDFIDLKVKLRENGIATCIFEPKMNFSEFKTDDNGMIPVVVQDYKTDKVLMLAYMNEESFDITIKTGKMTYFSRSRNEIWIKGMTSGNFQYVKELKSDCDNDTLLAKVRQIGVPCHTGADTCFFNEIIKTDYDDNNPARVFEDVYNVILDRKKNPKEGSYTNYLFEKGIDKILKKVGEEATEIVIAAKNPDAKETKYEISDFIYHVMVLMVEKGITWKDITKELSRR